jgi:hypothetical protein
MRKLVGINLGNIEAFIKDRLERYGDERIGKALKANIISAYNFALEETPQWSGHMAVNLTIEVDGQSKPGEDITTGDWRIPLDEGTVSYKGNGEFTDLGRERNSWVDSYPFTIETQASLSYVNEPTESYYAKVEAGENLRDVNQPGHVLARAEAYVRSTWGIRLHAPLKEVPKVAYGK